MKNLVLTLSMLVALIAQPALAGSRDTKKLGLYVGFLAEPIPSVVGFNIGYNLASFVRLSAGYGTISLTGTGYEVKATTIAGEAKFMLPDWNFTPFATLGYSNVDMTVTGTGADTSSLGGLGASAGTLTYGFGIDWQTNFGFNLGFSYKMVSKTGDGLPGFYLGWYF